MFNKRVLLAIFATLAFWTPFRAVCRGKWAAIYFVGCSLEVTGQCGRTDPHQPEQKETYRISPQATIEQGVSTIDQLGRIKQRKENNICRTGNDE